MFVCPRESDEIAVSGLQIDVSRKKLLVLSPPLENHISRHKLIFVNERNRVLLKIRGQMLARNPYLKDI